MSGEIAIEQYRAAVDAACEAVLSGEAGRQRYEKAVAAALTSLGLVVTYPAAPLASAALDCRSEHGVGHSDCPKCWHRSERNPNGSSHPVVESLIWAAATWRDVRGGDVVRMPGNPATESRVAADLLALPWHVNDHPPKGLEGAALEQWQRNLQYRPNEYAMEWTGHPVTLHPLNEKLERVHIPNVNLAGAIEIRTTAGELAAIEALGGWVNRVAVHESTVL